MCSALIQKLKIWMLTYADQMFNILFMGDIHWQKLLLHLKRSRYNFLLILQMF